MPVRIEANSEPIPGYRLIERLGGGGFGEVWKAEAPGGLYKAIKFVFGDLSANDDTDGARAVQELKALSRVKSVHHPYILSLERYDIIDGQLVIVMELADRTLWDRFRECRSQGLPGIPRTELLQYLRETAEALDLMNIQFQLQHLDIKPQNIFLVFNHVKVADFGLVKDLGNMAAATVTGGVTPVYAAPETFDGWLSRYSDQYSLSIVYQELLTGQRPFAGSTMRQLVLQHLQGAPEVSSLPMRDRAIVLRALAKNPDERYPTCLEFVQALLSAGTSRAGVMPTPPQQQGIPTAPPPPTADTKINPVQPAAPQEDMDQTRHARGQRPAPAVEVPKQTPPEVEAEPERPNMLPPRPQGLATPQRSPADPQPTGALTHPQKRKSSSGSAAGKLSDSGYRGIVQPSLIVGLGKLGVQTLVALRRALSHAFGHPDALPHVRLVGIDTDPASIHAAGQGEPQGVLRPHEVVLARLHRPSHYLQQRTRDGELHTDSWLNSKLIYRLPKQQRTAGLRALGRLAFVDNFRHITKRLETELEACIAQDTLHEMVKQTDLGIRSPVPRVYVVASLGGATGGGMFLDTAYGLRHLLRKHGFGRADVVGVFFLPPTDKQGIRSSNLAQTYAALKELHHFASGQSAFSARYGMEPSSNSITEAGPPFERCMFLPLPAHRSLPPGEPEPMAESAIVAGQFLYRDVATPLGKAIDAARQQWRLREASLDSSMPVYQTFGLYRILWPRRHVLKEGARRLCGRLVQRWMSKDAAALTETLAPWAQEQWDESGLRPEGLIAQHQGLCEQQLQQPAERVLQDILNPLVPLLDPPNAATQSPATSINLAPVVAALASLEKVLGFPEECRTGSNATMTPGIIEKILTAGAAAVADGIDRQLTALIVRLLEEPAYRLAGAEEGLRQFSQIAEQSLQAQEALTKELHDRAAALYQRIQKILESPQPANLTQTNNSVWKFTLTRKPAGSGHNNFAIDLLELLRVYAKTRYQCLILRQINRLYVSLRGHLSDQIREVGFCRQRLSELAGLLEHKRGETSLPQASSEKVLLPSDCKNLSGAVDHLDKQITEDDLLAFDNVIQALLNKQFRALLNVCMGPSNLVRNLAPIMVHEAEEFLAPRVPEFTSVEFGLDADQDVRACAEPLTCAFDEAAPELGKLSSQKEIAVVAFPATPTGQELKEIAKRALPNVQVIDGDDRDEITFYRELQQVTLQDLEQFGAIAQEAYRQRAASDPNFLHTRIDVAAWQPAAT